MPALQPYLIEPIWQQFQALLPRRETNHPLGCHRPRVPNRVIFAKLLEVLVFGCAYWRIADESCSESTLRRRRDEWIAHGLMERLREISLEAYDRLIGLELFDVTVDGCITKAPCGCEKAERSPVGIEGQGGSHEASSAVVGAVLATAPIVSHFRCRRYPSYTHRYHRTVLPSGIATVTPKARVFGGTGKHRASCVLDRRVTVLAGKSKRNQAALALVLRVRFGVGSRERGGG